MTYICIGNLTVIGSDNGLSPERRQAIIWTNAGILLIGPLETNFNEILIRIQTFSFKKMHLKISSAKWRPFCLGLNVLIHWGRNKMAAIMKMIFWNAFSCMKLAILWFKFHSSLYQRAQLLVTIISLLVWVIAWRSTSNKPSSEPMMVWLTDICHSASMSLAMSSACCLSHRDWWPGPCFKY